MHAHMHTHTHMLHILMYVCIYRILLTSGRCHVRLNRTRINVCKNAYTYIETLDGNHAKVPCSSSRTHACIHTYESWSPWEDAKLIESHIYTYIHVYTHTCIHTYMYTYTWIMVAMGRCHVDRIAQIYLRTYMYTYIHVYIHTCIHT